MVNIEGLEKEKVLLELYNNAKSNLDVLFPSGELSEDDCKKLIQNNHSFDRVKGRIIRVDLSSNKVFDETLYDKSNGAGKAQESIEFLKAKKEIIDSHPCDGDIDIIRDDQGLFVENKYTSDYEKDNGFKRLIYTISFDEKKYSAGLDTHIACDCLFVGKDIRTGEIIKHAFTYIQPYSVYNKFFGFNDVLGFSYQEDFIMYAINHPKIPTYEEIREEYKELKNEGLEEFEINNDLMKKYAEKCRVRLRSI